MSLQLAFLNPKMTLFLLSNVQEKFPKDMPLFNNLIENSKRLTEPGKILNIPLKVTEQSPEKLGQTVKELDVEHSKSGVSKTRPSMLVPEIESDMRNCFDGGKPSDVVLFGLECHIFIEQTCIELLERKINVFVVADCVASHVYQDRDMALERLCSADCSTATCKSIIYNILRDNNHTKFDSLRKLLLHSNQMKCK